MKKIGEGKSKLLFEDGQSVVMEFKGDVRCSTQEVLYDLRIAKIRALFTYEIYKLISQNIPEVLVPEMIDEKTLKMESATPIPLEWIPRFVAAGSVVKRFGFEEGYIFSDMILKIDYKTDVDDYLITDELIVEKGILSPRELREAKELCKKIANFLNLYFREKGLVLWDFKMELAKNKDGKIVLIDEISLDGMRLKDLITGESFDKDVYRRTGDLELLIKAYETGYQRIFG